MANDKNKYSASFSFGVTLLSIIVLICIFHWGRTISNLLLVDILSITIIGFIIGFATSIVLYLLDVGATDFNISSLFIIVLTITLYILVGDVKVGTISIAYIMTSIAIASVTSFILGITAYILLLR